MSKLTTFYYIVKGASKGDNAYTHDALDEKTALKELHEIYDTDRTGLSIEILTKNQHDKAKERIHAERLKEAEQAEG